MGAGVFSHLEQRPEEVLDNLLEAVDQLVALVNVEQPRDLI